MAHIGERHSRPGLGGTTAGVKAMALPAVEVRRVLEERVAGGLATRPSQGSGQATCGENGQGRGDPAREGQLHHY